MAPSAVATPNLLSEPGYLFIAALGTAGPTNTVAGSVFTDAWPVGFLPVGATQDGSTFSYSLEVSPMSVAEFYDPVKYATTGRSGHIAFAMTNFGLTNYRRALNGGVSALAPTSGTGATALYTAQPTTIGQEVRAMIGWESLDNTVRFIAYQTICSGEVAFTAKKAPDYATIPCTFNMEIPSTGVPFTIWGAGATRA